MTPNSSGFGSYELSFSTKSTLLLQSLTRVCKIRKTRCSSPATWKGTLCRKVHFFLHSLPLGKTYSLGKAQDNSKTRLKIQLWQRWVFERPDPNALLDRSAITALSCFTTQLTVSTVCSFTGSNIQKFALDSALDNGDAWENFPKFLWIESLLQTPGLSHSTVKLFMMDCQTKRDLYLRRLEWGIWLSTWVRIMYSWLLISMAFAAIIIKMMDFQLL